MPKTLRGKTSPLILSEVADLHGRRRQVGHYRRGQFQTATFAGLDELEPEPATAPDPRIVRAWLVIRVAETIEGYRRSGRFSEKELKTIEALWLEQVSLRRFARREGVTPEAIRARIEGNAAGQGGLKDKAPEFYQWWDFKNRRRRGNRKCGSKI